MWYNVLREKNVRVSLPAASTPGAIALPNRTVSPPAGIASRTRWKLPASGIYLFLGGQQRVTGRYCGSAIINFLPSPFRTVNRGLRMSISGVDLT